MSASDFIEKVKSVHGDKYILDKVNFVNATTKVTISCPEHGDWEAVPSELFRGVGCPRCGGSYRYSQQEYIDALKKVHGDTYDLSKTIYTASKDRVTATCKEHGDFTLRADHFLSGGNCPECARIVAVDKTKKEFEFYLAKFQEKHGDKYDYSKFDFKGSDVKGTVVCPDHGEFLVTPVAHVKHGCYDCGKIAQALELTKTPEEKFEYFLNKARRVHGNKFEYFIDSYKDSILKTMIKCNKKDHVFWQLPASHLRGVGCPYCNESKGEIAVSDFLQNNDLPFFREYKIPEVKLYHKKHFEYDFCLLDYKILIEFHGKQHYEPVSVFGGEDEHEKVLQRDFAKEVLAKTFGYTLIVIHYKVLERGLLDKYLKRQLIRHGVPSNAFTD